jgi:hypothetical protein
MVKSYFAFYEDSPIYQVIASWRSQANLNGKHGLPLRSKNKQKILLTLPCTPYSNMVKLITLLLNGGIEN